MRQRWKSIHDLHPFRRIGRATDEGGEASYGRSPAAWLPSGPGADVSPGGARLVAAEVPLPEGHAGQETRFGGGMEAERAGGVSVRVPGEGPRAVRDGLWAEEAARS